MDFETEMTAYAEAAHELVTMRSRLRADTEERSRREAMLWMHEDVQAGSNEKIRKATYEALAAVDSDYQDLLGAIQLQHDAISHREVDEQVHKMWARYLTAVEHE